jgi:hypothetical protein
MKETLTYEDIPRLNPKEVVSCMLIALGSANRPMRPKEIVKVLPPAGKRTFYGSALANPLYECHPSVICDSFVRHLIVDSGRAMVVEDRANYYGLTLTAEGRAEMQHVLDTTELDSELYDYFDDVVLKAQAISSDQSS